MIVGVTKLPGPEEIQVGAPGRRFSTSFNLSAESTVSNGPFLHVRPKKVHVALQEKPVVPRAQSVDGDCIISTVGLPVGDADGNMVGLLVGALVGELDGAAVVGDCVGDTVGLAVGAIEGGCVGAMLGGFVGLADGEEEGAGVGELVGDRDGGMVGL